MNCIEILTPGPKGRLKLAQRPIPEPGPGEVLIKVVAAGINRPDIFQRKGLYPPPLGASDIPGLEVAGEIVAAGESSPSQPQWQVGTQVCALLSGGGYAEYAIAHQTLCLPIPKSFSLIQAAALPETYFTVWHNVFERAALQLGETLLVHGGTSGIGTTAIQLATAMGHRVFTTASSDKKCQQCLTLGAAAAINYSSQDYVAVIKELTNGRGVDVILDMVGGDYVQKNIQVAAFRGRIVAIAFLRGSKITADIMPIMLKQLIMTGSTLRSRPLEEKSLIAASLRQQVWPFLGSNNQKITATGTSITPLIDSTFPLDQAMAAHKLMESNQHMGKIVLTLP